MSHYYCDKHDHPTGDYGCEDCAEEQGRDEAKREHSWMAPTPSATGRHDATTTRRKRL